jgi:hypothetical protein
MKLVYEYVKTSIVWNGEKTRTSYDGIKEAWNKKSGSSGSINLILITFFSRQVWMLFPLLVSERSNGLIDSKLPFVGQFNMVIASVKIGITIIT